MNTKIVIKLTNKRAVILSCLSVDVNCFLELHYFSQFSILYLNHFVRLDEKAGIFHFFDWKIPAFSLFRCARNQFFVGLQGL